MLGMPTPTIPHSAQMRAAAPPAATPQAEAPPAATPRAATPQAKFAGTLLGIARPGIAPNPDRTQNLAHSSSVAESKESPTTPVEIAAPSFNVIGAPFPTSRPLWKNAAFLAGGVGLAAAIGGGIALLRPSTLDVQVHQFTIDDEGNDELKVSCPQCPEGTQLILGKVKSTIHKGEASLQPSAPLKLGKNELKFRLIAPDGEELRARPVVVPVAFRVNANWNGRHADAPYAEIVVSAPPKSIIQIDGKQIGSESGTAKHTVSFAKEATGENEKLRSVAVDLPVTVKIDKKTRRTSAALSGVITPLSLSSPASHHQLAGKPLTINGRTSADAEVEIAGKKIQADSQGLFSLTLESVQPGPLLVRAHTPRTLTRTVQLHLVKRVKFPKKLVTRFKNIKKGALVNISGNVLESRVSNGTTVALLEVDKGCSAPPCLLRAVYGEPVALRPNRRVRILGEATGGSPLTLRVRRFH